MNPEAYGDRIAGIYDSWYDDRPDTDAAVAFLSSHAGSGRILELGVGTGRLAMRLAQLGHEVTGVDISEAMLDQLRAKDDGHLVTVHHRDMTDLTGLGRFSLIFVAFGGLFGLQTAEEQVNVFTACASALEPSGKLVVEAHVPSSKGLSGSGGFHLVSMSEGSIRFEVMQLREAEQRLDIQLVELSESGATFYPSSLRYMYRSEMELMGRLAGLEVMESFASWLGAPVEPGGSPLLTVFGRTGTYPE